MTLRGLVRLLLAAIALVGEVQAAAPPLGQVMSRMAPPVDGQPGQNGLPNRLAGEVGVVEALGARVDPGLTFVDERGRPVRLGSLFAGDKPVMLAFVYHDCPMLCSLVLDGIAEAVQGVELRPGVDYEVLAVSMDPTDTPALAAAAKARYVEQIGGAAAAGLHFWTVTPETEDQVRQLAAQVGFRYGLDVVTGEYAHSAATMFLSPQGVVTRYLYGIAYPPRDVRLALVEAGEGTIGTTLDRFLLTCFVYDEHAQGYSLAILTIAKYIGGGLLLLFVGFLGQMWLREGRRQRADTDALDAPHAA